MSEILQNNRGSVLIVVLWTLIMIGYLVGDYLVHNRSKAGTAVNLMDTFRRDNAVSSLVRLVSTDAWKAGVESYTPDKWVDITVGGVALRFRLDEEGGRINVNSADDATIRQAVVDIMDGSDNESADALADAILDWRDPNDLVRVNGAESPWYESQGLENAPADGLYKALTELLMVKGMTRKLFWGDPGVDSKSTDDPYNENEPDERNVEDAQDSATDEDNNGSFLERFTIFDGKVKRLSILIPLSGKKTGDKEKKQVRLYTVLFLQGPEVAERYTEILEG